MQQRTEVENSVGIEPGTFASVGEYDTPTNTTIGKSVFFSIKNMREDCINWIKKLKLKKIQIFDQVMSLRLDNKLDGSRTWIALWRDG